MRADRFSSWALTAVVWLGPVCCCPHIFGAPTTQQWVDQLSADDPVERSTAESRLRNAGTAAIAPLRKLVEDSRPEVNGRALRVLRQIQISTLPDLPANQWVITQNYLSDSDPLHRKSALNLLLERQPQANALLARLAVLETDDDLRRQILYRLRSDYRTSIGRWLAIDQDPQGVLQLLNGSAAMWGQEPAADYAAGVQISGLLDQQIQIFRAEQTNGDIDEANRAARELCFLYRLANQPEAALKAAREAHEQSLVFLVLGDQGNWDAASREPDDRWHDPVITSALRAGYQRLADQQTRAMDTMSALVLTTGPDTDDSFIPSKFFMLNDMPDHGMDLMVARHPAAVCAMRIDRGEYSLALELARKYSEHPSDGPVLRQLLEDHRRNPDDLPALPAPRSQSVIDDVSGNPWQTAVADLAQKQYHKAADEFEMLFETDHAHYDRLYLQGYCLKLAGDVRHGQALMQTAALIPLGDPDKRWEFSVQLEAAGLADIADAQRQLALHTGAEFDEVGFSNIYNSIAAGSIARKQWQTAADAVDRLCLINLSSQVQWPDSERLLTIPALAHLLKSRRDRERGDLGAAFEELKIYQQYLPASAEMVLEWTPALDDLGQHQRADALFDGVYEKLKAVCEAYPKSVSAQNQLAWMCACCGRKLDEAQTHAQLAIALKPDNWQTIDTLAEVQFRRGDRKYAIDLERRACGLSNDPYLSRQLKRFENAAIPSTTQPGVAPE